MSNFKNIRSNWHDHIMDLVDWHDHIMDFVEGSELGLNNPGLCYGGATTASQAFLLGKEQLNGFIESVNASDEMTVESMASMKKELQNALDTYLREPLKAKCEARLLEAKTENPGLTPEQEKALLQVFNQSDEMKQFRKDARARIANSNPDIQKYMDTLALLQNIEVNFNASKYPQLLSKETELRGQQTVVASFKAFQPESENEVQRQKNTIVFVTNNVLPYQKNDIARLVENFVKMCKDLNEPLSLNLGGNWHQISCSYDPTEEKWLLFDMNQQPVYGKMQLTDVSSFIWEGLVTRMTNLNENTNTTPVLVLHSEVMTTEYSEDKVKAYIAGHDGPDPSDLLNNISSKDNLFDSCFQDANRFRSLKTLQMITELPWVDSKVLSFSVYWAIARGDNAAVTSVLARSPKLTYDNISVFMRIAIRTRHFKSLSGLLDSPTITPEIVAEYLRGAIEGKDVELIKVFASSDKLTSPQQLLLMFDAINRNDLETLSVLSSSFKGSMTSLVLALEYALREDKPEATGPIIASGRLSEEQIADCIKSYTPQSENFEEKTATTKQTINFIEKVKSAFKEATKNPFKKSTTNHKAE